MTRRDAPLVTRQETFRASIAVARNALLLTANRRDFELVPGLRFANWLD